MADYQSELMPLPPALLNAGHPLVHEHVSEKRTPTSSVRVLGKAMHVLAAGWALSIGWLWIETIQQHLYRRSAPPPNYALDTVASGAIPAVIMALIGWGIAKFAGRAPQADLERREWWHAFFWSLFPNVMLLVTVWVMLQEGH